MVKDTWDPKPHVREGFGRDTEKPSVGSPRDLGETHAPTSQTFD